MSRHPAQRDLAAWFDGEDAPGVGDHVRDCRRCRSRLGELSRIRAAVRGEQMRAGAGRPGLVTGGRRVLLVPVVIGLVMLLVTSGTWDRIARPVTVATRYFTGGESSSGGRSAATDPSSPASDRPGPFSATSSGSVTTSVAGAPSDDRFGASAPADQAGPTSSSAPDAAPPAPREPATLQEAASAAPPAAAVPGPPATPLRLGAFVPADGFDATEGRQVTRALHRAVEAANAAGGVAGRKVELLVVPADDPDAVASLPQRVDAIVGGFGAALPPAPAGRAPVPWLFPAEAHPGGKAVVAAELSPVEMGARLGEDLVQRGWDGPVGVIRGDGPDEALRDGLAGVAGLTLTEVEARRDTGCTRELLALRSRKVVAVAVAGPPELAARCVDARTRLAWHPRGGMLVPASAAYAHLEVLPTAAGARTVLGLPWPSSDHRGAARYRAAVPGPSSYRALVSYAAVELAVQVARAKGSVTHADVTGGHWSSDLFEYEATRRAATVVHVTLGRWEPDEHRQSPRPAGSRRAR